MIDGLTDNDVPKPTSVSPQLAEYQSTVSPPPTEAEIVDDDPLQIVLGDAAGLVGVFGRELTVTVTDAQVALTQPVVVFRALAK